MSKKKLYKNHTKQILFQFLIDLTNSRGKTENIKFIKK